VVRLPRCISAMCIGICQCAWDHDYASTLTPMNTRTRLLLGVLPSLSDK
jgi:hypothetical protein